MYGVMHEVFTFAASFTDLTPRSFPLGVNPATIQEDTLEGIKDERRKAGSRKWICRSSYFRYFWPS